MIWGMETSESAAWVAAWAGIATALGTLGLVWVALVAWHTARGTLEAARAASEAARAANEQARRDSIERTRPYVYLELVPGLGGDNAFDVRVVNTGRSAARELTIDFNAWPETPDDVAESVQELFETSRTLPPGCSIRAMWQLKGNFSDGTTSAGIADDGHATVRYTSDDPSEPQYRDTFDLRTGKSGFWPVPERGAEPGSLSGDARKFYMLARVLVRRVGELGR